MSAPAKKTTKRKCPEEVAPGTHFNLGDQEAQYGTKGTPFKAPRYRKPKEVTEKAKNIGAVEYGEIYDKVATKGGWFAGVIPFLATPKRIPGPRINKIMNRTEDGIEADQKALGKPMTDAELMPPPNAIPIKRFTPQELRQMDLALCMQRVYDQEGADVHQPQSPPAAAGVNTTVITTNSTTVTQEADRLTFTNEHRVSASSSVMAQPVPPSPLRSEFDGSVLPSLGMGLSLSAGYMPYSPFRTNNVIPPTPAHATPIAVSDHESYYYGEAQSPIHSSPFRHLAIPSPARSVPSSPRGVDLVDQLPSMSPFMRSSISTPTRTPNEYNKQATLGASSQNYDDLLLAHFNAELASQSSK